MFHLLIVDDEKIVADGLAKYIKWEDLGFNVVGIANNFEQAVQVLTKEKVHVLLSDIIMEGKSGLELIEYAIQINKDIKCIILSGHEDFSFAKSAIKLGVYDYLVKPIDFDELETLFKKIYTSLNILKNNQDNILEKTYTENSEGIIINKIKEYIHNNYNKNINLNQLAEIAYVHPTYLSILFKKKTCQNFTEYLTKLRIERAKEFLDDISLRISDVSYKVGYDSPKHFSKTFKEITGITPKEYRNRLYH